MNIKEQQVVDEIWQMIRETNKGLAEMKKVSEQNQKMIGDLGNKFGSFAEGMALPSMEKILEEQFGATHFSPRHKVKKNGEIIEIDALGYSNGTVNTAVVVEIKSHLKGKDIEQVENIMNRFFDFFPEQKGKKLYGIIAYIDGSEEAKNLATKKGFYLANIHEEIFEMKTPRNFVAKDFSKQ